jgi:hypothetical protein
VTVCLDQDNQYFRLEPTITSGGWQYYWLRNTATNLCLDVPGTGTGGLTSQLEISPCAANDDHDWAFVKKKE